LNVTSYFEFYTSLVHIARRLLRKPGVSRHKVDVGELVSFSVPFFRKDKEMILYLLCALILLSNSVFSVFLLLTLCGMRGLCLG